MKKDHSAPMQRVGMPEKMSLESVDDHIKECMKNPEFKKAWDDREAIGKILLEKKKCGKTHKCDPGDCPYLKECHTYEKNQIITACQTSLEGAVVSEEEVFKVCMEKTPELVEKYFPKGKCEERGGALVLHAEMLIVISEALRTEFIILKRHSPKEKR